MTIYENLDRLQNDVELDFETAATKYVDFEHELVRVFAEYVIDAEVTCDSYGHGIITDAHGANFDSFVATVSFTDVTKNFSLQHIATSGRFIKFVNDEITEAYITAYNVHTEITKKYHELGRTAKKLAIEAANKAEADKKAAIKNTRLKDKTLSDFKNLTSGNRAVTFTALEEFYKALGWLVKHIGTISAVVPDYLVSAFEAEFGSNTGYTVVDINKKTSGNNYMKWSFSFTASVRKAETIPEVLIPYINASGKMITNTAFVYDLVTRYGFKFGKKQEIAEINGKVPAEYLEFFNAGLSV